MEPGFPKCKKCGTVFHYCEDCRENEIHERGYCSEQCLRNDLPRGELVKYVIDRFGWPDATDVQETEGCFLIAVPKKGLPWLEEKK